MLFAVDSLLLIFIALLIVSVLRLPTITARLVGIFLIIIALLIASVELMALFGYLTAGWGYPALHVLVLLGSYLIWRAKGHPPFLPSLSRLNLLIVFQDLRKGIREHPALGWLGFGVALFYLAGIYLVFTVPPNTNDSMSVHLARVGFWLQHGSLAPWLTSNIWQIIYPGNAQFIVFWTVLTTRSDHLVGFVQFLSTLISILLVYGLAQHFEQPRPAAFGSALLWSCFTIVILQSTSSQTDMLFCAMMVAAIYFFLIGAKDHNYSSFFLSALAVGIATGTKQIAFFFIPCLGLAALVLIWKERKVLLKPFLAWVLSCALAIILIGSWFYFQNLIIYGNPAGTESMVERELTGSSGDASPIDNLRYNSLRFTYNFMDFSGLPWRLTELSYQAKNATLGRLLAYLVPELESPVALYLTTKPFTFDRIPSLTEEMAWFGPVGMVILPIALLRALKRTFQKKDRGLAALLLAAGLYVVLVVAFRPGWSAYQGRHFLLPATLISPFLLPALPLKKGWSALLVFFSLLVLSTTALSNASKPLVGDRLIYDLNNRYHIYENSFPGRVAITVLPEYFPSLYSVIGMSRVDMVTISAHYLRDMARYVDANIPEGQSLGILFNSSRGMYPFFGEHFGRILVPVYPESQVEDCEWIAEQELDFVLVYDLALPEGIQIADCLSPQVAMDDLTLYSVEER